MVTDEAALSLTWGGLGWAQAVEEPSVIMSAEVHRRRAKGYFFIVLITFQTRLVQVTVADGARGLRGLSVLGREYAGPDCAHEGGEGEQRGQQVGPQASGHHESKAGYAHVGDHDEGGKAQHGCQAG